MSKKSGYRKLLVLLLKIALTVTALTIVFTNIDLHKVIQLLSQSKIIIWIPAIAFFILSKWISALRLSLLLNSADINISRSENTKLYLLGMYYNLFLPGGIGGDAYKVWYLNREYKGKTKSTITSIILDRLKGVYVLIVIAICLLPVVEIPSLIIYTGFVAIPLSLISLYLIIAKWFKKWLHAFWKSLLLSLAVQLSQLICAILILYAVSWPDNPLPYLLLFLISGIAAIIPFTIGGAGARELAFFFGSQLIGLNIELSIVLSLSFYLITALVSLSGGYYSINTSALYKNKII